MRQKFLVLTVNFAPYFCEPPLLFWLSNLSWSVFRVSRAAALLPIFAVAAAVIYLTARLAKALRPVNRLVGERAAWLLASNLVVMAHSSLVLFDLLLTVWILASFLAAPAYFPAGVLRSLSSWWAPACWRRDRTYLSTFCGRSSATPFGGAVVADSLTQTEPHLLKTAKSENVGPTRDVLTHSLARMPPVLRMRKGEPFAARLVYGLDRPTAIHWHGIAVLKMLSLIA